MHCIISCPVRYHIDFVLGSWQVKEWQMSDPTTLDNWILICTSDLRFLPTAPTAEAAGGTEAVFCTEVVA